MKNTTSLELAEWQAYFMLEREEREEEKETGTKKAEAEARARKQGK